MIRIVDLHKEYSNGVRALAGITLSIERGDMAFLMGRSGAGKSTLINIAAGLERATSGRVFVNGKSLNRMSPNRIAHLRRQIGMVFQDHRLLENRTVAENCAFALRVIEARPDTINDRVREVLDSIGLASRAHAYPHELSGGESQRVAIARALVNRPLLILADEPTGNLDTDMAEDVVGLLEKINGEGTTVLIATHNRDVVLRRRSRIIYLENGQVRGDTGVTPRGSSGETDRLTGVEVDR